MAREFNGSTDRIDYSSAFTTSGSAYSFSCYFKADTASPAANGLIWNSAVSGGAPGTFINQVGGSTRRLRVGRGASTGQTIDFDAAFAATGTWYHLFVTSLASFTGTPVFLYIDGVSVTATSTTLGAGPEVTADQGFRLGGRSDADTANFDGQLQNVAIWNRVLSAFEREAIVKGAPPEMYPNGLRFRAHLIGDDYKNRLDASGTLDGTTATQDATPRVYRPKLYLVGFGSVGAPAPTISSTSDTNTLVDESALTITGTNLTSTTAVTFKQTDRPDFDATAYIDTNGATSLVLDPIDIQVMGYAYGAATVEVTTAGGTTAPFAITISPASGTSYVTLAGHTTGTGYATDLASDNGDQLTYPSTVAGSTVSVDADGNISFTPDVPDGTTFTREWFDASADTWATDTVQIDGGEVADGDDEFLFRRHRYLAWHRTGRFNP